MPIFSMLIRSIISYTIFLGSRKLVNGSLGFFDSMKQDLKLHRCIDCYRLYSGDIKKCTLCGSFCKPLYSIYKENYQKTYEKPEKREGIEKQIYTDTRRFEFEPLQPPHIGKKNGTSNHTESSRSDQGRDRRVTGAEWYDRDVNSPNG